jgi:hypothetical protein
MIKKLVYSLLLLFLFTACLFKDDCQNLGKNELPLIRQGDTLIYTNSTNKMDTFRVTTLSYGYYTTGLSRNCYQSLTYVIDKVNNSIPDTAGFNQIHIYETEEYSLSLWFQRTSGVEAPFAFCRDSLYKQILISGKVYNSVHYYSCKQSESHCRNLYFSYQYGVLSIEINNHLTYLSEIRPTR